MKDLLVVVADSYQEKVLEGLLPRIPIASQISSFSYDIIRNISNDSGSYNTSHDLIRPFINDYRYAMIVFDHEGSGAEHVKSREETELDVENLLSVNGWEGRCASIVIHPELENWMWIDNPNVENAIGWEKNESLYSWAKKNGLMGIEDSKPIRPKETLEKALRICQTSKSSSIYKKISSSVSYKGCKDPAFQKLITCLKNWFT